MAKKTQVLQVAVDKTTEKMLRQQASAEDIPLSQVIRQAINSYLAATAPSVPSKEQVPS
jgi:hypothetical protein